MTTGLRRVKVRLTLADSYVCLGWWMIMSDDEQGYAPAAFLEPLDASVTDRDLVMEAGDDEGMLYNHTHPHTHCITDTAHNYYTIASY